MTLERQRWWGSLPQREKMLREQIWETKGTISKSKFALQRGRLTDNDKKWVISRIKKKKVVLAALKHELNRGIKDVDVEYCPWCGGEIKGGR